MRRSFSSPRLAVVVRGCFDPWSYPFATANNNYEIRAMNDFVHLHIHSEYSLADGSMGTSQIIKAVQGHRQTHAALTDHSNMHGAVEFYLQAKEADIVPIIGCEVRIASFAPGSKASYNLVLLAKNTCGYKKLVRVVSAGFIGSASGVIAPAALEQGEKDLVAIASFSGGEFAALALKNADAQLRAYVDSMRAKFGANFFIEICQHRLPGNTQKLAKLAELADYFSVPLVASANAHYQTRDFLETHAIAVAIKNGISLAKVRGRLRDVEFHLASSEEMFAKFSDYPEALANTRHIAEACSHVEIEMGKYYLPKLNKAGESVEDVLRSLARSGLDARLAKNPGILSKRQQYVERLDYELEVIVEMGFADYFLIVQDFINWAKTREIPVGPGRGSGAGSLVAYALAITDIDPIPYNLIFERFLNPERVSMPDFDVDFCQWRREEVINYCVERYGAKNVAQITTFGRLNAKAVFKAVGRVKGLGYGQVDRFTKLFPNELGITLQQCIDAEPRVAEQLEIDDDLRECMSEAMKIEGLVAHTSVHPAGVVISDGDMTNYLPIFTTDGSSYITQFEMKPTEKVGLVKFDFLGLKTLTVIDHAVKMIKAQKDPSFDIATIPLDDASVFKSLENGYACGVFQCESSGMQNLIAKLKPSTFEDIIALVALFRPGPLGSGMVDDFVMRKHGKQKISYLLFELEPILKDTYGMILYQEQVQKIAAVLADYSLGEADLLRRAMGKKIPAEMAKQKERFLSGACKNGVLAAKAEEIFELMAEFAKYGFNKSHSAAYGLISYQTAFVKHYHPEYYLAACMTCDMDNTDKLVRYIEECRRLGIKISPPNINISGLNFFVPCAKTIDFALVAIKGLGEGAIAPLLASREEKGPYQSIADLAARVHLGKFGKKNLQLMAASGALDGMGYARSTLNAMLDNLISFSTEQHDARAAGRRSLFNLDPATLDSSSSDWDASEFPRLSKGNRAWELTDLFREPSVLGSFVSDHPLRFFQADFNALSAIPCSQFAAQIQASTSSRVSVRTVGVVLKIEQRRTKKGSMIAYIKLDQIDSSCEGVMFASALEKNTLPLSNTVVLAEGTVDKFGDSVNPRFAIERIRPVEQLRGELVKELKIVWKVGASDDAGEFERFESLVRSCAGDVPVLVFLQFDRCKIKLCSSEKLRLRLDNQLITMLAGFSSVKLTYVV